MVHTTVSNIAGGLSQVLLFGIEVVILWRLHLLSEDVREVRDRLNTLLSRKLNFPSD